MVPRSEMDNGQLIQPRLRTITADSFLRPGETLEDFDVEFRRPNAQGGRIGFKKGKLATTLTPQMVIDIAENNPDFTATDIVKKLQKR